MHLFIIHFQGLAISPVSDIEYLITEDGWTDRWMNKQMAMKLKSFPGSPLRTQVAQVVRHDWWLGWVWTENTRLFSAGGHNESPSLIETGVECRSCL